MIDGQPLAVFQPFIDTATGRIDLDMPKALQDQFWHQDFGIYAEVQTGGTIRPGDEVEVL